MDQTQSYADNQTLVAYFDNPDKAQRAVDQLRNAGFSSAHLGFAHRGGSSGHSSAGSAAHKTENAAHNMWEKVKDFFEGRSPENYGDERTRGDAGTREITDPGVSTNAPYGTSSGYTGDDLQHSLTGMNVPEYRSRYFGRRFESSENGCILTVNASGRVADAERILRDNGGDLGDSAPAASTSESAREVTGGYNDRNMPDRNLDDRNREDRNPDWNQQRGEGLQNIQLLGEVLRVHKDRLNRGEVVVRKDIITENQTVQVPVTREELVVEHQAADGNTPARGDIGDKQEIHIPLTEETASLDKGTVVREEVAVGKKPVQEVRNLSGEVRREELVVDDQTQRRAVNE
jgi:uncharacterized protein (TIGR02271 family)